MEKLSLKQDFKSNIDIAATKTKIIIIETNTIFCCRLGSLISLIEKLLLKQDFKSNIDIAASTNEDDICLVILFPFESNVHDCTEFWCA